LLFASPIAYAEETVEMGLDEALRAALKSSRELSLNAIQRIVIEANMKSARAAFLPTVSFSAAAGTNHIPENPDAFVGGANTPSAASSAATGDINFYQLNLSLTENIFAGFSDISAVRLALLQIESQEAQKAALLRATTQKTLEGYLRHLYLLEKLKANEEILELRRKRIADIEAREKAGRATALDVMQAQFELNQQQSDLIALKSDIDRNNSTMMRLLGRPISALFRPRDSMKVIFESSGELPPLDKAYSQLVEGHPTLKEAALNLQILETQYDFENGKSLPKVDFALDATHKTNRAADLGSPNRATYSGQLRLSMPIFSGLSSFSDREKYQLQREQKRVERETKLDDLYQQLETAFEEYRLANARLASDEANLKLCEASVVRAESLYAAGRASNTDVLEQYTRKLNALYQLAQTRYNRVVAKAKTKILIQGGESQ
jgi:outer membrane protein TolC